jgi:hypothetical protein
MYTYTILNREKEERHLKFKSQGYYIPKIKKDDIDFSKFKMADKLIELTPQEMFIDGLNFKLTAIENYNKQAVERQQAMQVVDLLSKNQVIGKTMIDETGMPVTIDEYKIYKKTLKLMSFDDIFKKAQKLWTDPAAEQTGESMVPQLNASPQPQDIIASANQVNPGVTV